MSDDIHYECPDDCSGCTCFNNPPCTHCVNHSKLIITAEEMEEGQIYRHAHLLPRGTFYKKDNDIWYKSGFNGICEIIKPTKGQKFIEIKE